MVHEILLALVALLLVVCLLWLGWLTERNGYLWRDYD